MRFVKIKRSIQKLSHERKSLRFNIRVIRHIAILNICALLSQILGSIVPFLSLEISLENEKLVSSVFQNMWGIENAYASLALGDPCTSDTQCGVNFCVDDVCCDSKCDDTCQSCDQSGNEGYCTTIPQNTDPDGECGTTICSAWIYGWSSGNCVTYSTSTAYNGLCSGGTSCNNVATSCSGAGATSVSCKDSNCNKSCPANSYVTNYDSYAEVCYVDGAQHGCAAGEGCNAEGDCLAQNGQSCTVDSNCISDNCVATIFDLDLTGTKYCAPADKECSGSSNQTGYDTADEELSGVELFICKGHDLGGARCRATGEDDCDEYVGRYCSSVDYDPEWIVGSSNGIDINCATCTVCGGTSATNEGNLSCSGYEPAGSQSPLNGYTDPGTACEDSTGCEASGTDACSCDGSGNCDIEEGFVCSGDTECISGNCDIDFDDIWAYCHATASSCVNGPGSTEYVDGSILCSGNSWLKKCNTGIWDTAENSPDTANDYCAPDGETNGGFDLLATCTDDVGFNNPSCTSCSPYKASSTSSCYITCSSNTHCWDDYYCNGSVCEADLANGSACDENTDCTSGHCQNGYCCDSGDCCATVSDCTGNDNCINNQCTGISADVFIGAIQDSYVGSTDVELRELDSILDEDEWAYKMPFTVDAAEYDREDYLISFPVDFTQLYADLGTTGTMCDTCFRVAEHDGNGAITSLKKARFVHPYPTYNAATNAQGRIDFVLNGITTNNTTRNFYLVFDKTENGTKAAPAVAFDNTQVFFYPETDLDGDGKSEIVIADHDYGVEIIKWNGVDAYESVFRQAWDMGSYPSLAIADVDGNGKPNLLVSYYANGYTWSFEYNSTSGEYENVNGGTTAAMDADVYTYNITVGDLDMDGINEVIAPGYAHNRSSIYGWNGSSYVKEAGLDVTDPSYWNSGADYTSFEEQVYYQMMGSVGDIDGDGVPEMLGQRYTSSGRRNLWQYGGNGTYEHQDYNNSGYNYWGSSMLDVDMDGYPELITDISAGIPLVYDFDGETGTWSSTQADVDVGHGYQMTGGVADWDGDGIDEFVVGELNGRAHVFQINPTTGAYEREWYGRDEGSYGVIAEFGDTDDDGVIEVIYPNSNSIDFYESTSGPTNGVPEATYTGSPTMGYYYSDSMLITGRPDPQAHGVGAPKIIWDKAENMMPESYIKNTGGSSFDLTYDIVVEKYVTSTWNLVSTIVSDASAALASTIELDTAAVWDTAGGWNTGTQTDGDYRVRVRMKDDNGTTLIHTTDGSPLEYSYEFMIDTVAPTISFNTPASNGTAVADPVLSEENTYEYVWKINTDELALCRYSPVTGDTWGDMVPMDDDYKTTHFHRLQIIDESSYNFYIKCRDVRDNESSEFNLNFTTEWDNKPTSGPASISSMIFNDTETVTLSGTCYDMDTTNATNDGMKECQFQGTQNGVTRNGTDWKACTGTSCSCSCTVTGAGVGSTGCPDFAGDGDWAYRVVCRDQANNYDSSSYSDSAVRATVSWGTATQESITVSAGDAVQDLTYKKTVTVNNPDGTVRGAGWSQNYTETLSSGVDSWSVYDGSTCSGDFIQKDIFVSIFDRDGKVWNSNIYGDSGLGVLEYQGDLFEGTDDSLDGKVADFNNDGYFDILSGGDSDIQIYSGSASGTFTSQYVTTSDYFPGDEIRGLAVADFDNDGDYDIFGIDENEGEHYFENGGSWSFTHTALSLAGNAGSYVSGMDAADFDDDGNMDVIAQMYGSGTYIYYGNGDDTFDAPVQKDTDTWLSYGITAADFTGDGDVDYIKSTGSSGDYYLYTNDGSQNFSRGSMLFDTYDYGGITNYDLDNDGDQDLIISHENYWGVTAEIAWNNGSGVFTLDKFWVKRFYSLYPSADYSYAIAAPEYDPDIDTHEYGFSSVAGNSVDFDIHAPDSTIGQQSLCYTWDDAISVSACTVEQDTDSTSIAGGDDFEKCTVTVSNSADVDADVTLNDACVSGAGGTYTAIDCGNQSLTVPASGQISYTFKWKEGSVVTKTTTVDDTRSDWCVAPTTSPKERWTETIQVGETDALAWANIEYTSSITAATGVTEVSITSGCDVTGILSSTGGGYTGVVASLSASSNKDCVLVWDQDCTIESEKSTSNDSCCCAASGCDDTDTAYTSTTFGQCVDKYCDTNGTCQTEATLDDSCPTIRSGGTFTSYTSGGEVCTENAIQLDSDSTGCNLCVRAENWNEGGWNLGGEIASTNCCGDDANEYSRATPASDGSMDGTITDSIACCNAATDCAAANVCTTAGSAGADVDGDTDIDYCDGGTWKDCSTAAQCLTGYNCVSSDCIDNIDPVCGTWDPSSDQCVTGSSQDFILSGSTDSGSGISDAGGTCTVTVSGNTCTEEISDVDGNTVNCVSPVATFDNSAPPIPTINQPTTPTADTNITVTSNTVTDTGCAGSVEYQFCHNTSNTTTGCTSSSWSGTASASFTGSVGDNFLFVRSRDGLSQESAWSSSTTVVIEECLVDTDCASDEICVGDNLGIYAGACSYSNTCRTVEMLTMGQVTTTNYSAGNHFTDGDSSVGDYCGDHAYQPSDYSSGDLCVRVNVYDSNESNVNAITVTYDQGDTTTWTTSHSGTTADIWSHNNVMDFADASGHFAQMEIREWDTGFGGVMFGYKIDETGSGADGASSTGCCPNSTDCVDDSLQGNVTEQYGCYTNNTFRDTGGGDGTDTEQCRSGVWYAQDSDSTTCTNDGNNWNLGGEVAAITCCGDDTDEYARTTAASDGTMDGTITDDTACCNAATDCAAGNTCTTAGFAGSDVDGDGDNDFCDGGIWKDCDTGSECPVGFSCNSNDCVDATGPINGSVSHFDGLQNSTTISVTVSPGTDNNGMSTTDSDYLLEVRTAILIGSTCGTFGTWTDAGVNETAAATNYSTSGSVEMCHQFRYTSKDSLGNSSTFESTDTTKITNYCDNGSFCDSTLCVAGECQSDCTANETEPCSNNGTSYLEGGIVDSKFCYDEDDDGTPTCQVLSSSRNGDKNFWFERSAGNEVNITIAMRDGNDTAGTDTTSIMLYRPNGTAVSSATITSWTSGTCDPTNTSTGCFNDDGTTLSTDPVSDLRWKKITIPSTTDLGIWQFKIVTSGTDVRNYVVFDTDFVRADSISDLSHVCTADLEVLADQEYNSTTPIPYSFWVDSQAGSTFDFKMYYLSGGTTGYTFKEFGGTSKGSTATHTPAGAWYTDTITVGTDSDEVWTVESDDTSNGLIFGFADGVPPMVSQGVGRFPEWAKTKMCLALAETCTLDIQCSDGGTGTSSCYRGECKPDSCIPPLTGDWTPTQSCTFVDEIHQLYGDWIINNGITMRMEGSTKIGFGGETQKIRMKSGGKLVQKNTARLGNCEAELEGSKMYLAFEEGSGGTVADWSQFENDATTSGGTWVTGGGSRGDALKGGITITPDDSSLDFSGAMTVSFWVRKTVSSIGYANTAGVNKWKGSGDSEWALMIGDNNSDVPQFYIESDVPQQYVTDNITALSINTWYHLVGVFDGTDIKLYIDGVERGTNNIGATTLNNEPGRDLYIGGRIDSPAMTSSDAEIDEVRVFNRALSLSEIQKLGNYTPDNSCVKP